MCFDKDVFNLVPVFLDMHSNILWHECAMYEYLKLQIL